MRITHYCVIGLSVLAPSCTDEAPGSVAEPVTTSTWSLETTPNVGLGVNELYGVSAAATNDAWAVGYYSVPPGVFPYAPLAEHWDGTAWTITATPAIGGGTQPKFNAVLDLGPTNAWAVGSYIPSNGSNSAVLVEHWNGRRWSQTRVPMPPGTGSGLDAISGTSASDIWAVGFQGLGGGTQYALTMHYDGSRWSIVPTYPINLSGLFAVKAITPTDAWAVGVQYKSPLAIHWDGTAWTSIPLPIQTNPPIIDTVPVSLDATASDDVWAVGWENEPTGTEGQTTFAEAYHWDGTSWTTVTVPGLATSSTAIHGVAALARDDVWVLGDNVGTHPTIHFDGTSWTAVPNPGGGFYNGWHPLAATPTGELWAVGRSYYSSSTFALHYE